MSLVVKAALDRIFQEFQTTLNMEGAESYSPMYGDFTMEVPSSSRSTLFGWIANQAIFREWVGQRVSHDLQSASWEVVPRRFELTYKFDQDQIDDDLSGLVAQAVGNADEMNMLYQQSIDALAAATLEAGISSLCWDGQFFFDTDHPVDFDDAGAGTFDNDRALALNHANFRTVLAAFKGFKARNGYPIISPAGLVLVVPPALELEAKQIVEIDSLSPGTAYGLFGTSGASKNPYVNAARVHVNPYLTDTTRWYLMGSRGNMKPLAFVRRQGLVVESDDSQMFDTRQWRIGGNARHECTYTSPLLAITSKP